MSFVTAAGALLALAACSYTTEMSPPAASLQVVNGAEAGVVVLLDGSPVRTVAYGSTASIDAAPGSHTIEVRRAVNGSPTTQQNVTLVPGKKTLVVAVEPAGGAPQALVYGDTNAIVPAGASKLRVIHAAANAPAITVRRTQPDFDSLITVMFPFPYGASSGYVLSTPGTWTIVVSHENQSDTLVATGSIAIPDGHSRTVVLIDDSLGGIAARIVDP